MSDSNLRAFSRKPSANSADERPSLDHSFQHSVPHHTASTAIEGESGELPLRSTLGPIKTDSLPCNTHPLHEGSSPARPSGAKPGSPRGLEPLKTSLTRSTSVYSAKKGLNLFGRARAPSSGSASGSTGSTPNHSRHLSFLPLTKHRPQSSISTLDAVERSPEPFSTQREQSPVRVELLGISEQLRHLATKEMAIVETRDSIKALQDGLAKQEAELHELKQLIKRSLQKEISPYGPRQKLNQKLTTAERDGADSKSHPAASHHNRTRSSSSVGTLKADHPVVDAGLEPHLAPKVPPEKRFSFLTKPLDLLNQFDLMLQAEFEKSLKYQSEGVHDKVPTELDTEPPQLGVDPAAMASTVSNSLWSFVSEVKSNLMHYQDATPPPKTHPRNTPKVVELGVMHSHKDGLQGLASLAELPSGSVTPVEGSSPVVSRFPAVSLTPTIPSHPRFSPMPARPATEPEEEIDFFELQLRADPKMASLPLRRRS